MQKSEFHIKDDESNACIKVLAANVIFLFPAIIKKEKIIH